jgi:large subunit ribosomal protein L10
MNRTQKAEQMSNFAGYAKEAPFIVLAHYQGTKVADVNMFRRTLEKNGMRYKVIKNSLARRAFAEAGVPGLDDTLVGMTGVVFSGPDAIGSAKVLKDLLKGLPTVQVRAGYFDGATMDAKCVDMVSSLPSREDLLAQLLSTLIEGPRQLVSVIQAPARDLVQLLKNYEDKLATAE